VRHALKKCQFNRAALRLGLYELLYLRGAPDYAVVAEAVELAKANGRAGHGLVNAVLRRAAREGAQALLGSLSDETPERAAIKHSHPEWIARLWWEELGADEARALMAVDNEPGEGRHLFDHALRGTNGRSCATCHVPDRHFTLTPADVAERLAKDLMSLRLSPCTARLSAKFQSS